MGGRDHSCETCGRGGLNDIDGENACICQAADLSLNGTAGETRKPSEVDKENPDA